MNRKKLTYIGILFGIITLAVIVTAGAIFSRSERDTSVQSAMQASHPTQDDHRDSPEGSEDKEKCDLDRSVGEMWTAKCEHNILQYTCDECRYELGVVKLSSTLLPESGKQGLMKTTIIGEQSFTDSLSLTGEVRLSEGKTVHVSTPLPGLVRTVVADIGRAVRKGDVLFEIDSHEVAESKGDYMKKEAVRDLAKKTAEREAKLFEKKISAEAEVQEAQARLAAAEVDLANARMRLLRLGFSSPEIVSFEHKTSDNITGLLSIRAPRSGIVIERNLNAGENVEPGKDLFLLSDLSEVWVWADLRENDIPALAQKITGGGGKIAAEVRTPGSGDMVYRGMLDILSGTMNEQTRTLKARIIIPNPEGMLRPGMFVNIKLLLSGGESLLSVPKVAVLTDEGRPFVFVHKEGDFWVRRPVSLGKNFGDMVEIQGGLISGQKIIADGSFLLKSDVLRKKMGAGCAD